MRKAGKRRLGNRKAKIEFAHSSLIIVEFLSDEHFVNRPCVSLQVHFLFKGFWAVQAREFSHITTFVSQVPA